MPGHVPCRHPHLLFHAGRDEHKRSSFGVKVTKKDKSDGDGSLHSSANVAILRIYVAR
jgi:hypothetical protein